MLKHDKVASSGVRLISMKSKITNLLKKCRVQKGLSLATLGDLAGGITPQHLHEIEKGEIDPRLSTLERIAKVLGCKIELLMPNDDSDDGESFIMLNKKARSRIKKSPFITIGLTDDDWGLFEKQDEDDLSRKAIVDFLNKGLETILNKPNSHLDEIRALVHSLPEESYGASDEAFRVAWETCDYLDYELRDGDWEDEEEDAL